MFEKASGWRGFRAAFLVLILVFLPGFGSGERLFAPKSDLWPRWSARDAGNEAVIDHDVWDRFLKSYVVDDPNGVNLVAYAKVSPADRAALDGYLAEMAAIRISGYAPDEQLAYWLNLYNALTVRVVLDHPAAKTIRDIDISPGWFASGPWDAEVIEIEGEKLTLNDIEHRIIRPVWRDPRIHYGVNCASIGCPNLAIDAYTGAAVDAQLEEAARSYVNDPRGVSISGDEVTVSKIYDWFIEDFGDSEAGVLRHLKRYAAPELKAELERIDALEDVAYDWALNGAPR